MKRSQLTGLQKQLDGRPSSRAVVANRRANCKTDVQDWTAFDLAVLLQDAIAPVSGEQHADRIFNPLFATKPAGRRANSLAPGPPVGTSLAGFSVRQWPIRL